MKKKEHIHLYNDYLLPTQRNFLVRENILKLKYHRLIPLLKSGHRIILNFENVDKVSNAILKELFTGLAEETQLSRSELLQQLTNINLGFMPSINARLYMETVDC